MRVVEVYLFHGFLGLPQDWNVFEREVVRGLTGKSIHCRFHKDNLWIDYQNLINEGPHGGKSYFEVWGQQKRKEFEHLSQAKIFLGYSLGGRLLMHLPLGASDNVIFAGYVSAHPGLESGQERKERRMSDTLWHDHFTDMSWEDLMKAWNSQGVFQRDTFRPRREELHYQRDLLARYFKDWSLGLQQVQDQNLKAKFIEQKWIYGEQDEKFKGLAGRMSSCLGAENCVQVSGSGHGILWDNPKALAKFVISQILEYGKNQ